jgi:hypothetical protein
VRVDDFLRYFGLQSEIQRVSLAIGLELSSSTEYDDAMSRCTPLFHLLPFAVVILTGCTTLVRSYDRIRAVMTKGDTDEQSINNYGAFFRSSLSLTSELPNEWTDLNSPHYPVAKEHVRGLLFSPCEFDR